MTPQSLHTLILIAIMAIVTALIRFLPFLVFARSTPKPLQYLGTVLPYAIMAMLVVYCLKSMDFIAAPHALPEIIAIAIVVILHKWKHNTLLSIVSGTVSYMLLVQVIFR